MIRTALSFLILGTLSWAASASVPQTVSPVPVDAVVQVARHGADDPAGHTRREDRRSDRRADRRQSDSGERLTHMLARRGADDAAGDTRREDRRADRRADRRRA